MTKRARWTLSPGFEVKATLAAMKGESVPPVLLPHSAWATTSLRDAAARARRAFQQAGDTVIGSEILWPKAKPLLAA